MYTVLILDEEKGIAWGFRCQKVNRSGSSRETSLELVTMTKCSDLFNTGQAKELLDKIQDAALAYREAATRTKQARLRAKTGLDPDSAGEDREEDIPTLRRVIRT